MRVPGLLSADPAAAASDADAAPLPSASAVADATTMTAAHARSAEAPRHLGARFNMTGGAAEHSIRTGITGPSYACGLTDFDSYHGHPLAGPGRVATSG